MLDPCPVPILNNGKSGTKLLLKMCLRGNSTFQRHKCLPGTGPLSSFLCLLFICISRENSKERQKVSLLKTGSRGTVSHSLPGVNEILCLWWEWPWTPNSPASISQVLDWHFFNIKLASWISYSKETQSYWLQEQNKLSEILHLSQGLNR